MKTLHPIARIALIMAVMAILSGSLVPAIASANSGTEHLQVKGGHQEGTKLRLGIIFIYAALDTSKHPIQRCKAVSRKIHYNINVKWRDRDPDSKAILRLHITPPNKKEVALYESKTGLCASIKLKEMQKTVGKMFKAVGGAAAALGKRLSGPVAAFFKVVLCQGKC